MMDELLRGVSYREPEDQRLLTAIRQDHEDKGRLMDLLLDSQPFAREQITGAMLVKVQVLRFKAQQLAERRHQAVIRMQQVADSRIIAALVVLSLLSMAGLALLIRRVNQGVDVLLTGMKRAASGDLDYAIPVSHNNEFGALALSFNDMSQQLRQAEIGRSRAAEALKDLNAALEQKVQERTAKLKRAYQALEQSQAQMLQMEKLSALGTLIGGVAHEVNNPLMGIRGYLEYAIGKQEPGRPREMLQRAVGEVERIARIVKNMLVFSRLQPANEDQRCDPARVIPETLALVEGDLRQAGIALDVCLPPRIAHLRCDSDALRQVLLNLLLNARDALKDAPAPHRIVLSLEQTGSSHAVLHIADNGQGVPEAIKARIFDPFFTTKKSGNGTGLGLAVSHQLISNAGGRLTLAEAEDGGAVFSIELKILSEDT
jgi:C4-dicarboxylate-specific signal transduction histidine kinase